LREAYRRTAATLPSPTSTMLRIPPITDEEEKPEFPAVPPEDGEAVLLPFTVLAKAWKAAKVWEEDSSTLMAKTIPFPQ